MASHRLSRLTMAKPANEDNTTHDATGRGPTLLRPDVPVASTSASASSSLAPPRSSLDASDELAASTTSSASEAEQPEPELYNSVKGSRTVEDFTRFVSELRLNRQASRSTLPGTPQPPGHGGGSSTTSAGGAHEDAASFLGEDPHTSNHTPSSSRHFDDDNASILDDVSVRYGVHSNQASRSGRTPASVRCTCCCHKADCERANRAMSEWAALEEDLRLAAEIGQSLLHKHDAAVAALSKAQEEHVQQRDSLMTRLTQSIRESAGLQRQLAQTTLNLEAADASNRTLLSELDEARSSSQAYKRAQARLGIVEKHAEKLTRELDDMRAELASERKRADMAEAKAKKLASRIQSLTDKLEFAQREAELMAEKAASPQLGEEALREARERLQLSLQAVKPPANGAGASQNGEEDTAIIEMRAELEVLAGENARLKEEAREATVALESTKEEAAQLREALQEHTLSATVGARRALHAGTAAQPRKASSTSVNTAFSDTYSIPVSRGSAVNTNGDASLGEGVDGAEDTLVTREPVALSDEIVRRDLTAPLPPMLREPSIASEAGSAVLSPTTTSASTIETLTTAAEEGDSTPSASLATKKAPSIRSQNSGTHRRTGSVASSSRGAGAGEGMVPGGRSSTSIAPSASSMSGTLPDASASPSMNALAGPSSSSSAATGLGLAGGEQARETRTTQLANLLDYGTRIYNRLVSVDIDTLQRRLQRQHLAGGDVGHLARTTVNSIIRDVEALRAHFRKLTEAEQRAALQQPASLSANMTSESLVSRRDFFALLKMLQNLFAETARLRACVNEIHLQPSAASKILSEHLGLSVLTNEGGGVGALMSGGWLAKMFTAVPGAGAVAGVTGLGSAGAITPGAAGSTLPIATGVGTANTPPLGPPTGAIRANSSTSILATPTGDGPVPLPSVGSGASPGPRAAVAAVQPSAVAVEVKASARGTATPAPAAEPSDPMPAAAPVPRLNPVPGRSTLTRTQSRNLSGLFAGAGKSSTAPASTTTVPLASGQESSVPSSSGAAADESWDVISQADASMGTSAPTAAQQRQSIFFRSGALGGGAGAGVGAGRQRPLSRIVDDDEISIHQGRRGYGGGAGTGGGAGAGGDGDEDDFARFTSAAARANAKGAGGNAGPGYGRTLHRRGLSDSSMHSTFLDQEGGADGVAAGGQASRAHTSAAGLLVRGSAAAGRGGPGGGGAAGSLANLRTSPMARIITPATLSLQVSANASGRTSAQFARSVSGSATNPAGAGRGKTGGAPSIVSVQTATSGSTGTGTVPGMLGIGTAPGGRGPNSPSLSEDSLSIGATSSSTRDKRSGTSNSKSSSGPRGLMPTLRAAPSAVALLFPGAATPRTASASSSLSATNVEGASSGSSTISSGSPGSGTSPGRGHGGLPR